MFASTFAVLLIASTAVWAGEGNSDYLGTLSSTAPSGYKPSPAWYDLSAGQNMVTFQFSVTNKTAEQQSMTLQVNFDHIITYRGLNVSDGQPGVTNGAVVDGQFDETQSTQVQDSSPSMVAFTIAPNATETVTMSHALQAGACGYYQADVAKAGLMSQKGLVGFEVRVLGCTAVVPSPSPSPTPTGGAGGATASSSPTPGAGGVGAGGATTPSGGVLGATATATGIPLANTGLPIISGLVGLLFLAIGGIGTRIRRK